MSIRFDDLDSTTEATVEANLARLPQTRIVIAHRLSTVRDADLILVLDSGRIVQRGTHEQLIAVPGRYAELHAAQAHASRPAPRHASQRPPLRTPYSPNSYPPG